MKDAFSGPRDPIETLWMSLLALIVVAAILAAIAIVLTEASLLVSAAIRP